MVRDAGNGDGVKAHLINTIKYEHLALVYIAGRQYPYIGQKFGKELRKPFIFISGKDAVDPSGPPPAPGVIPFVLIPILWAEGESIFIEGSYFWHFMKNADVQKTYHNTISPIISL